MSYLRLAGESMLSFQVKFPLSIFIAESPENHNQNEYLEIWNIFLPNIVSCWIFFKDTLWVSAFLIPVKNFQTPPPTHHPHLRCCTPWGVFHNRKLVMKPPRRCVHRGGVLKTLHQKPLFQVNGSPPRRIRVNRLWLDVANKFFPEI